MRNKFLFFYVNSYFYFHFLQASNFFGGKGFVSFRIGAKGHPNLGALYVDWEATFYINFISNFLVFEATITSEEREAGKIKGSLISISSRAPKPLTVTLQAVPLQSSSDCRGALRPNQLIWPRVCLLPTSGCPLFSASASIALQRSHTLVVSISMKLRNSLFFETIRSVPAGDTAPSLLKSSRSDNDIAILPPVTNEADAPLLLNHDSPEAEQVIYVKKRSVFESLMSVNILLRYRNASCFRLSKKHLFNL